jgi:hypothetical protein
MGTAKLHLGLSLSSEFQNSRYGIPRAPLGLIDPGLRIDVWVKGAGVSQPAARRKDRRNTSWAFQVRKI